MSHTGSKSLPLVNDYGLICFLPYAMRRPDNYREQKSVKRFAYSGVRNIGP